MRALAAALAAGLLALPPFAGPAEPDKAKKTAEQLYAAFYRGPWRADGGKSRLRGLWLHRGEKGPANKLNEGPWGLILDFSGGPEGYRGTPEKVEADGDGLKITLP